MIVIDANVAIRALLSAGPEGVAAQTVLAADLDWYVPGCFIAEVLSVCRRAATQPGVDPKVVDVAAGQLTKWQLTVIMDPALATRIWALRHNVSAFDACYVAVAEYVGCTLVTADAKLAAAAGPRCAFQVV